MLVWYNVFAAQGFNAILSAALQLLENASGNWLKQDSKDKEEEREVDLSYSIVCLK